MENELTHGQQPACTSAGEVFYHQTNHAFYVFFPPAGLQPGSWQGAGEGETPKS